MSKPYQRPNNKGTQQLNLRIESYLVDWLKERADRNERPMGRELALILKVMIKNEQKDQAHAEAERADYIQNREKIDRLVSDGSEFGAVEDEPAVQPKGRKPV